MLQYMMRPRSPYLKASRLVQTDNQCVALLAALLAARGVSSQCIGQFIDTYSPPTTQLFLSNTSWQSSPSIPLYTNHTSSSFRRSPRLVIDLSFNTNLTSRAASAVFVAALLLPSTYNVEVLLHGCSGITSLSLDPWHNQLSSITKTSKLVGIRLDGCPIRFFPRQFLVYCNNVRWLSLRATRIENPTYMAEIMDSMPSLVAVLFTGDPSYRNPLARSRKFATQASFLSQKSQQDSYYARQATSYRGYPIIPQSLRLCPKSSMFTHWETSKRYRRRREQRFRASTPPVDSSIFVDDDPNLGDDERINDIERNTRQYESASENELENEKKDIIMSADSSASASFTERPRSSSSHTQTTQLASRTTYQTDDYSEDDSYSEREEREDNCTPRVGISFLEQPNSHDFEIRRATPVTSHPHYRFFALAGARTSLQMLDGEPITTEECTKAAYRLATIYESPKPHVLTAADRSSPSSSTSSNQTRQYTPITHILRARALGYSHASQLRRYQRRSKKSWDSPDLKRRRVHNNHQESREEPQQPDSDGTHSRASSSNEQKCPTWGSTPNLSHLSRPTQMAIAYAASTASAAEAHLRKLDDRTAARLIEHRRTVLMGIAFRNYYDTFRQQQKSLSYRSALLPKMLSHASLPPLDKFERELTTELDRILGPGNVVPSPRPLFYKPDHCEGALTTALVNRPGPPRIKYFNHANERPRQFEFNPILPTILAYGTEDGNLVVMNQETGEVIGSCRVGGGKDKRASREVIKSTRSLTNITRTSEDFDFPIIENNSSSVFALSWLNKQSDMFISGTTHGTIHIYNVRRMHHRNGNHCAFACDTFNGLTSIHVNSNDTMFAVSGESRDVGLFDINTGIHTSSIKQCHNRIINVIKFAHYNPNILLTSSFDRCVKKWDLRECSLDGRRRPIYTSSSNTDIVTACFSPDDSRILVSGVDNEVQQLTAVDGRLEHHFNIRKTERRTNFTRSYYMHNGEYIITGSSTESTVRIFNAKTGALHSETEMDDQRYLTSSVYYVQTVRANPWRRFNFSALLVSGNDWKSRVIANVDLLERDTAEW